jgi:hypothetical protein
MIREISIMPAASIMNRLGRVVLTAAALLVLAVPLSSGAAGLKEQLVGTWKYVSADKVGPGGGRTPMYGSNPQGLVIFDGTGHYVLLVGRSGVPKFASNNTKKGTPRENKAAVQGSIAHFGTYTINEADKAIIFHVQFSTFPNWNGTEQKRPFTLTGDDLKWTIPETSSGGVGEIVLKRVK